MSPHWRPNNAFISHDYLLLKDLTDADISKIPSSKYIEEWTEKSTTTLAEQADCGLTLYIARWITAMDEAEYASIWSDINFYLQPLTDKRNNTAARRQQSGKAAMSFFYQFECGPDPDTNRRQSTQPQWKLGAEELTALACLVERLFHDVNNWFEYALSSLQQALWQDHSTTYLKRGYVLPWAPGSPYISKLIGLRNRIFPARKATAWVNMNELRLWLDHCDSHHVLHCQFSPQSKRTFLHRPRRLIHVNRLCLVPAEAQHRYVALSYVWGTGTAFKTLKRNIDILQLDGSISMEGGPFSNSTMVSSNSHRHYQVLPSRHGIATIPQTILDVIKLTQQLGEKFLWVDSLCIVQDDEDERQDQLQHMGSIYAHAYVTVVASGGTDFTGRRGFDKAKPPRERMPHGRPWTSLRLEIEEHHQSLQNSDRSRRAWTFQEHLCPRRLLIFQNTGVTWESHCAVWFDGVPLNAD
jgi:hypothetical protein